MIQVTLTSDLFQGDEEGSFDSINSSHISTNELASSRVFLVLLYEICEIILLFEVVLLQYVQRHSELVEEELVLCKDRKKRFVLFMKIANTVIFCICHVMCESSLMGSFTHSRRETRNKVVTPSSLSSFASSLSI